MRWQIMVGPALLVLLSGCRDTDGTTEPPIPPIVAEVGISPSQAYLLIGQSVRLAANPKDQRGTVVMVEETEVTWSSSDPAVVSVSSSGTVKGESAGSATVSATCRGVQGSALIRVGDWRMEMAEGGGGVLYRSWGSSAGDVFAVGSTERWACCGRILHHDGSGWSAMAMPLMSEDVAAVWGSSASDVFAVGRDGTVLHYDGTVWAKMPTGIVNGLAAVWGSSGRDVFAAGEHILHYDGQGWSPMAPPAGAISVSAIWGSSGTNVFAVGAAGILLHYDGTVWQRVVVPTTYELTGIWGSAEDDIFVVGTDDYVFPGSSVILHFNGEGWSEVEATIPLGLFGVWGTSEDIFTVGEGPTILHGRH